MAVDKLFVKRIICHCNSIGCTTKETQKILEPVKKLSIRQIQRILKESIDYQEANSLDNVIAAILKEIKGPGCLLGYRSMWHRLKLKYNISVTRDVVMHLLAIIDPEGTTQRKSRRLIRRKYLNKGPNFSWHVDGYDKLKPYGIAIHGCIDGYSRKVLWLKAASSNNDPRIIANYYLHCVKSLKGCPRLLRADMGTENSIINIYHKVFRHYHEDALAGTKSFRYGKSVSNQRIEALWCHLRKQCLHWWISFFKNLVVNGYIDIHTSYYLDIIRFCFGALIQSQLDTFVQEWNSHRIRPSKKADAPAGSPNVMFNFLSLQGADNYMMTIDPSYLAVMENEVIHSQGTLLPPDFHQMLQQICTKCNIPDNPLSFNIAIVKFCLLLKIFE